MARKTHSEEHTSIQSEVIMLRTQGYTIRQICNLLQIKSTSTVHKEIKNYFEQQAKQQETTVQDFKNIEINRCDERFGRLAEWRSIIEKMNIPPDRKLTLLLSLEDRELKNQERLAKLLNLEDKKIEANNLDFNRIRERIAELGKLDKVIEDYPETTGEVR